MLCRWMTRVLILLSAYVAEDHTKDIKLSINSPGGSITAGAILNVEAAFNQYATS
jgi:ATP-dependent protease ClpP protease subunit